MIDGRISDLRATLEELGLQEYESRLFEHGFDTWNSLANINETDMDTIGIKLGHRRKIQRENARRFGHPANEPLLGPPAPSERQKIMDRGRPIRDAQSSSKSDAGYVVYARFLCQDPNISNLSLVETAHLVAERWSMLPSHIKDAWNVGAVEQKAAGDSKLTQYLQSDMCHDHGNHFTSWKLREAQCNDNLPETQAFQKATASIKFIPQYPSELANGNPTGSRLQILGTIGKSTPRFHGIAAGHSQYGMDIVNVKREIEDDVECDSKVAEITDIETELSQFVNVEITDLEPVNLSQLIDNGMQPAGFYQHPSCLFDVLPSDITSPINPDDAKTLSLLSNPTNDFENFSQITDSHSYAGKDSEAMVSQNIPGDQHYRQSGLSEVPRPLYVEPREVEYLSWSFTANQQTPASNGSYASLSTTRRTAEPLSGERILDEPDRKISTQERQCQAGLNPERIKISPTKKRRISRDGETRNEEEVAALGGNNLLRNCRSFLYQEKNHAEQPRDFPFPI